MTDPNYPLVTRVTNALTLVEVEMELFSRNMSLIQGLLGTQPNLQEGAVTIWNRLSELGNTLGHCQQELFRATSLIHSTQGRIEAAERAHTVASQAMQEAQYVRGFVDRLEQRVKVLEGQTSGDRSTIRLLEARMIAAEGEIDELVKLAGDMLQQITSRAGPGVGVVGPGAAVAAGNTFDKDVADLKAGLDSVRRDLATQVKSIKMSVAGTGVLQVGMQEFDNLASCEAFCRTYGLDKKLFYEFLIGPCAFFAGLADINQTVREYTDAAILSTKTSLNPM